MAGRVVTARVPLLPALFAAGSVLIAAESAMWHRGRLVTHWNEYGASARLRLAAGACVTSGMHATVAGFVHLLRDGMSPAWVGADILAQPVSDVAPPRLDDLDRPGGLGATPQLTIPWNVLGLPVASVPVGFDRAGLPVGLQLVGRPAADADVLALAASLQSRTTWHLAAPAAEGIDAAESKLYDNSD